MYNKANFITAQLLTYLEAVFRQQVMTMCVCTGNLLVVYKILGLFKDSTVSLLIEEKKFCGRRTPSDVIYIYMLSYFYAQLS